MVGLIQHSHSVSLGTGAYRPPFAGFSFWSPSKTRPMCPVQALPNRGTSVPCSPLSGCQELAIRRTIKSPLLYAPDSFPSPQIHLACLPKPLLRRRGPPRPPRSAPPKMITGVSPSFGSLSPCLLTAGQGSVGTDPHSPASTAIHRSVWSVPLS